MILLLLLDKSIDPTMSEPKSGSKIFEPFRALGLHSSEIGHVMRFHNRHKEHYVFTAVGKVFHTYNCSKFGLCQVSNQHDNAIECIAADAFYVYTSCDKVVHAFQHNRQVKYIFKGHKTSVHKIVPFGKHLITVDRDSSVIVWHIETQEMYMTLEFSNLSFEITTMLHPITYINKIVFGSKQGQMQLWNICKNKMLYEYVNLKASPITVLEQAPAVDTVGVGNDCGDITLLNLRTDKVLMRFNQDNTEVTAITFRTDGQTIMASGSVIGHVFLWDLDDKKLKGKIENAHFRPVAGASFLPGKPLLITNSGDNSLKMWEFDKGSGTATVLRQRCGHYSSQTKIRFYKDNSVVSAGNDATLRLFSCVHPRHDKSLGQASLNRKEARKRSNSLDDGKLPPIIDFALETVREGQWDGLIAAHHRHPVATTWNLQSGRMGSHKFTLDDSKFSKGDNRVVDGRHYVSSVACTACGNFCLIGRNNGLVDLYNIQSGIHRGRYADATLKKKKAHSLSVKGVAVDALNQVVVTAGAEGLVKFWRFKQKILLGHVELDSSPSFLNLNRGTSMLAVALDNFTLTVADLETRKVVRKFRGHSARLNDLCWSDDGRWVITSGMDCCVKTWDLPSASLIDCFVVDDAVTSLAFSPASDLLATSHVDDVGIYLWSNRTLYNYINLTALPKDFHPDIATELPVTRAVSDSEEIDIEGRNADDGSCSNIQDTNEQLEHDLITLSKLPYAKWANVLQLDSIRLRNKPKEPPKAPPKAPFFLPTVAGLTPQFLISNGEEKADETSRLVHVNPREAFSEFARLLLEAGSDYNSVLEMMKSMSILEIDSEIKSLSPDGGGSIGLLEAFLVFIEQAIQSKKDFEIVQAYFSLFLTAHTDTLPTIADIEVRLSKIDEKLNKDRLELLGLLNQNLCIVNFIKSATL